MSTVFNTHFHPENTGGNEPLRQAGATIVAHENTRLWMATPDVAPRRGSLPPAAAEGRAPDQDVLHRGVAAGRRRTHRLRVSHRSAHERRHLRVLPRRRTCWPSATSPRPRAIRSSTTSPAPGSADAPTRSARLVDLANADTKIVPGVWSGHDAGAAPGRARHDEDDLRPHGRSRARGRQRRGHAGRGRPEGAGAHADAIRTGSSTTCRKACGPITTSCHPMWSKDLVMKLLARGRRSRSACSPQPRRRSRHSPTRSRPATARPRWR